MANGRDRGGGEPVGASVLGGAFHPDALTRGPCPVAEEGVVKLLVDQFCEPSLGKGGAVRRDRGGQRKVSGERHACAEIVEGFRETQVGVLYLVAEQARYEFAPLQE